MAGRDEAGGEAGPRLPLAEAAARMGKSVDALRALIRRGRLATTRGNDGRLLVAVPPELATADTSVQARLGDDQAVEVARLRVDRDEARAEADHWRSLAHEHELALARAEGERDATRRETAAEVAAKDTLIVELKALLADARRPWWARLWVASPGER